MADILGPMPGPQPEATPINEPIPSSLPGAPSGMAASALPMQPAPVQPVQQVSSHGGFGPGKILGTIFGNTKTVYAPDPNNPDGPPVAQRVPMKSGEMFRHILGAGLLGLAAGAGSKDFGGGFQKGMGAGLQKAEADDQKARQSAQIDYENKLKERDEQRKEQTAKSQEAYTKAMILKTNAEVITEGIKQEREANQNDETKIKLYEANQLKMAPVAEILRQSGKKPAATLLDSEYFDFKIKNPDKAASLITIPVGWTNVPDKDGKLVPHQILEEYSIDDMKNQKVTPALQSAMIAKNPNDKAYVEQVKKVFPVGRDLDFNQAGALLAEVSSNVLAQRGSQEWDAKMAEHKATIAARMSEVAKDRAQANLANLQIEDAKEKRSIGNGTSLALSGIPLDDKQKKEVRPHLAKVVGQLNMLRAQDSSAYSQAAQVYRNDPTPDNLKALQSANQQLEYTKSAINKFYQQMGVTDEAAAQTGAAGSAQSAGAPPKLSESASDYLARMRKDYPTVFSNSDDAYRLIAGHEGLSQGDKMQLYKEVQAAIPSTEIKAMVDTAKQFGVAPDGKPVEGVKDETLKKRIVNYLVAQGYKVKGENDAGSYGKALEATQNAGKSTLRF